MNRHTSDVSTLDRDGYVVLNGILPPVEVETARQDLAKLFDLDVAVRKEKGFSEAFFSDGPIGQTILTGASHLALDMYGKSDAFDQLLERLLTHPRMRRVVEAWSGPHFRIGSVNISESDAVCAVSPSMVPSATTGITTAEKSPR